MSLSARRAWIEIYGCYSLRYSASVALRKESVDRNIKRFLMSVVFLLVALRKESVDRNSTTRISKKAKNGRSPQGERG